MSATVKYKGSTIASLVSNEAKTLKTSGKYCEADIIVENTQDGGGGGAYNVISIDNGDGTQTIEITDATEAIKLEEFSTSTNGNYISPSGVAYDKVHVNVPTGTQRDANDVTVNEQTVTIPSGLYSSQVSKSVQNGTAGTPSITKGDVVENRIILTPSVTNTKGYIAGGTKTGNSIIVYASELVDGTLSITENGNNIDVANYERVNVAVPTSSGKVGQACDVMQRVNTTSYTATNVKLTVAKTGIYTVRWFGYRSSTSGTNGSQLYINGTAYGSAQTSFGVNSNGQQVKLTGVSLTAGQEIVVRARARSTIYYMWVMGLSIIEE